MHYNPKCDRFAVWSSVIDRWVLAGIPTVDELIEEYIEEAKRWGKDIGDEELLRELLRKEAEEAKREDKGYIEMYSFSIKGAKELEVIFSGEKPEMLVWKGIRLEPQGKIRIPVPCSIEEMKLINEMLDRLEL